METIVSIVWDDTDTDTDDDEGNVAHIARHGVVPEEADEILLDPLDEKPSDSSEATIRTGFTQAGRQLSVVFVWVDVGTVYPITAFEPEPLP